VLRRRSSRLFRLARVPRVASDTLPLPPREMRMLVGPLEDDAYDNPRGNPVFAHLPPEVYESVVDLGCGCGRVARQLIQQRPQPQRYLGLDLHRGMVRWCEQNLAPSAPQFRFRHHDVRNVGLNPDGQALTLPLPVEDDSATLVVGVSVFTHMLPDQTIHYLHEAARVLVPSGLLVATWFLFDKLDFPYMQEFQNALYINLEDPSNAVSFDRTWVRGQARNAGLTIVHAARPAVRGFQWTLTMAPAVAGRREAAIPTDSSRRGWRRPPLRPHRAEQIGI